MTLADVTGFLTAVGALALALAQAWVIVQNARLKARVESGIEVSRANNAAIKEKAEVITAATDVLAEKVNANTEALAQVHTLVNGQSAKMEKFATGAGFTLGVAAGSQAEKDNPTTGTLPVMPPNRSDKA